MIMYENFTPFHIGTLDGFFTVEGMVPCKHQHRYKVKQCCRNPFNFSLKDHINLLTWISNTRLWPLKANAMMPRAFKMLETFPISDFVNKGLYDTPGGLVLETDSTHVRVQYVTAVIAPTREIPAMELRFGSWTKISAEHTKTRYKVGNRANIFPHLSPGRQFKKIFMHQLGWTLQMVLMPRSKHS